MPSDDKAASGDAFRLTSVILADLIHTLRTPLGVALTIAQDAKRGLPLSDADHEDAVEALNRLKRALNQFDLVLGSEALVTTKMSCQEFGFLIESEGYSAAQLNIPNSIALPQTLIKAWLRHFASSRSQFRSLTAISDQRCVALTIPLHSPDNAPVALDDCLLFFLRAGFELFHIQLSWTTSSSSLLIPLSS